MSAKPKNIRSEYPWTRSATLEEHGIPAYLMPCYARFFEKPDYVSEGGRPRWLKIPLPGPLWCAVCARVKGETRLEIAPLGFLAGWDVAYTGTKPMAEQALRQLVRQWTDLPHKEPLNQFEFDPEEAAKAISSAAPKTQLEAKLEEVALV